MFRIYQPKNYVPSTVKMYQNFQIWYMYIYQLASLACSIVTSHVEQEELA